MKKMRTYKIWYMKPEHFRNGSFGGLPAGDMSTHVYLKDMLFSGDPPSSERDQIAELEHIYITQQAENWSPKGEARSLILSKGLLHTSMSMGDVIEAPDGTLWIIAMLGFDKLHKGDDGDFYRVA
jgi:hypothetical protein